eukprot:1153782-Pelagomonas_calceolata.AAC.12
MDSANKKRKKEKKSLRRPQAACIKERSLLPFLNEQQPEDCYPPGSVHLREGITSPSLGPAC